MVVLAGGDSGVGLVDVEGVGVIGGALDVVPDVGVLLEPLVGQWSRSGGRHGERDRLAVISDHVGRLGRDHDRGGTRINREVKRTVHDDGGAVAVQIVRIRRRQVDQHVGKRIGGRTANHAPLGSR